MRLCRGGRTRRVELMFGVWVVASEIDVLEG